MPVVPDHVREIYQLGQTLGNDPRAFSILGDCQSLPETFLGVYETDPEKASQLPLELQELVTQFDGSFNRESPTVKLGTTAGAIIWEEWHENLYGCKSNETPLDCELRIHKPAFVIINLRKDQPEYSGNFGSKHRPLGNQGVARGSEAY